MRAEALLKGAGHSAGGYLAALHRATDWTGLGLPAQPLGAVMTISGLFDLSRSRTFMNDWLCLDEASASRLSLDDKPIRFDVPTDLFVGSEESAEFHRQSRDLAAHWPLGEYRSVPARDHFAILDELVEGGSIANSVLGRFGGMDPQQQH